MANEPINIPVTEDINELRRSLEIILQRMSLRIDNAQLSKDMDAANNQIKNVRWPTDDKDAVNVEYLRDFVGNPNRLNRRQANRLQGTSGSNVYIGRAKLPGVQEVGTEVLDTPYVVRLPGGKKIVIDDTTATCFVNPSTTQFKADFIVSTDGGGTWASIYGTGTADQLIIPVGTNTGNQSSFVISTLGIGDQVQVDVETADGVVAGVELVLRGRIEDV